MHKYLVSIALFLLAALNCAAIEFTLTTVDYDRIPTDADLRDVDKPIVAKINGLPSGQQWLKASATTGATANASVPEIEMGFFLKISADETKEETESAFTPLKIKATSREFEGFIEYGDPKKDNTVICPVYTYLEIESQRTVPNNANLLLGGVVTETPRAGTKEYGRHPLFLMLGTDDDPKTVLPDLPQRYCFSAWREDEPTMTLSLILEEDSTGKISYLQKVPYFENDKALEQKAVSHQEFGATLEIKLSENPGDDVFLIDYKWRQIISGDFTKPSPPENLYTTRPTIKDTPGVFGSIGIAVGTIVVFSSDMLPSELTKGKPSAAIYFKLEKYPIEKDASFKEVRIPGHSELEKAGLRKANPSQN